MCLWHYSTWNLTKKVLFDFQSNFLNRKNREIYFFSPCDIISALQNVELFSLKQYYRKRKWRETSNTKQSVINQRKMLEIVKINAEFWGRFSEKKEKQLTHKQLYSSFSQCKFSNNNKRTQMLLLTIKLPQLLSLMFQELIMR